ncbi:MAG: sugar transferase, partial [candidate division Zixibacteria bacterium]|nr:sugar transferase [candidate division Zixibacteria bacterium]
MKRIFDLILSISGLILLSPILTAIALKIKFDDGGPILYRGKRVGLHGKSFYILKFRSMVINADRIGGPSTSEKDGRITKIGTFLRKYKLDEIPQLINVIKGEMSIVGPRPEIKSEIDRYPPDMGMIFSVRPGITD